MNERLIQRKDRKLGHEWKEWCEHKAACFPDDTTASPALWLIAMPVFLFLVLVVTFALMMGIAALVNVSSTVISTIGIVLVACMIIVVLYFSLCVGVSVLLQRDYAFFLPGRRMLAALTFCAGHIFHWMGIVSRDRLGNSFIAILNSLQVSSLNGTKQKTIPAARHLLLLPRCIERTAQESILQRSRDLHIPYAIAGDGASARKAVERHNPDVILAIACERDLVTGIRDVHRRIPIICLTVQRPEGPCKNCTVDIETFSRHIKNLTHEQSPLEQRF